MAQKNKSQIAEEAKNFVKKEKHALIKKFADLEKFLPAEKPFSYNKESLNATLC